MTTATALPPDDDDELLVKLDTLHDIHTLFFEHYTATEAPTRPPPTDAHAEPAPPEGKKLPQKRKRAPEAPEGGAKNAPETQESAGVAEKAGEGHGMAPKSCPEQATQAAGCDVASSSSGCAVGMPHTDPCAGSQTHPPCACTGMLKLVFV